MKEPLCVKFCDDLIVYLTVHELLPVALPLLIQSLLRFMVILLLDRLIEAFIIIYLSVLQAFVISSLENHQIKDPGYYGLVLFGSCSHAMKKAVFYSVIESITSQPCTAAAPNLHCTELPCPVTPLPGSSMCCSRPPISAALTITNGVRRAAIEEAKARHSPGIPTATPPPLALLPQSPQTLARPPTPPPPLPLSQDEVVTKQRNKDEVRTMFESYHSIKLFLSKKQGDFLHDLEQSFFALPILQAGNRAISDRTPECWKDFPCKCCCCKYINHVNNLLAVDNLQ
ncbi:hypothetical protein HN51_011927 [Arachis hypogaea]